MTPPLPAPPLTLVQPLLLGRAEPLLSRVELQAAGVDDRAITQLLRGEQLVRLRRGWYAPPAAITRPEGRHRLTTLAHVRANSGRLQPSHWSALVVHELPVHGVDLAVVHLTAPSAQEVTRRAGLVVHPPAQPGCLDESGRVSTAAALVQTGMLAGPAAYLVSADAALARGTVGHPEIDAAADALRGCRGLPRLRPWLGQATPLSESVGESLLRFDLVQQGWDVEPQVEVAAQGRRYRADLRVKGVRVLVEFDGMGKYDAGGVAFRAEKAREEALRAAGWVVVRFMWQDLGRPDVIRRRMAAAVAEARRLQAAGVA